MEGNRLATIRESKMISKTELARRARLSFNTVNRVEKGYPCRIGTKKKIIMALGIDLTDHEKVFPRS